MTFNINDFNLKDTITCGQIFRYDEENDGSYTVILSDRVINIKQDNDKIIVRSNKEDNLKEVIFNYFDLNYDYSSLNDFLLEIDSNNKEIIESSNGLKMINEPRFEVIISYILSSNNRVPQIKRALDNISKTYGKEVLFNNKTYYLFPSIDELSNCDINTLRECKTGFRDKYIYEFINKIKNNEFDINKIEKMDSMEALNYLKTINGIGDKVASCILLFGFHRFDVFPIDTWVKKYMKEKYNLNSVLEIQKFMKNKYGNYSGLVIQYIFNYRRNKY